MQSIKRTFDEALDLESQTRVTFPESVGGEIAKRGKEFIPTDTVIESASDGWVSFVIEEAVADKLQEACSDMGDVTFEPAE